LWLCLYYTLSKFSRALLAMTDFFKAVRCNFDRSMVRELSRTVQISGPMQEQKEDAPLQVHSALLSFSDFYKSKCECWPDHNVLCVTLDCCGIESVDSRSLVDIIFDFSANFIAEIIIPSLRGSLGRIDFTREALVLYTYTAKGTAYLQCWDTVRLRDLYSRVLKTSLRINLCRQCLRPFADLVCSGCRKSHYCNRKCQKLNWKLGHRETCKHELHQLSRNL